MKEIREKECFVNETLSINNGKQKKLTERKIYKIYNLED